MSAPKAPNWLSALLCMAIEKLALAGTMRCEFKAHAGTNADSTYLASLCWDPMNQMLAVYVHHKASARFVCRSRSVVVDDIDPDTWNTDLGHEAVERPGLDGF
jgi:hypothetical protein